MDDADKPKDSNAFPKDFEQLKIANDLKTHEDQLYWSVFSMFWAANALLLVAIFQNTNPPFTSIKWLVIPFFGISISIIWYRISFRIMGYQEFYENLVARLEEEIFKIPERLPNWMEQSVL